MSSDSNMDLRIKGAQRLRALDTPRHLSGSAHAEIEITVASINFPNTQQSTSTKKQQRQYLKTMFHFFQLLTDNFCHMQDQLCFLLKQTYCMTSCHLQSEGSMLIHMNYATDKLLTLQCDQSCGHLTKELEACLITQDVLDALGVTEISLSVDLHNHR